MALHTKHFTALQRPCPKEQNILTTTMWSAFSNKLCIGFSFINYIDLYAMITPFLLRTMAFWYSFVNISFSLYLFSSSDRVFQFIFHSLLVDIAMSKRDSWFFFCIYISLSWFFNCAHCFGFSVRWIYFPRKHVIEWRCAWNHNQAVSQYFELTSYPLTLIGGSNRGQWPQYLSST